MSRSGYSDDIDNWQAICWRGAVASATKGRRGQAFFKELLEALDNMPVKRLITDELEVEGGYCTLGVIGKSRGIDMKNIDPEDPAQVSKNFDIAEALAQEIVFMNDEHDGYFREESPEKRWERMRKWVDSQITNNDKE
jgi:hypothetical protein